MGSWRCQKISCPYSAFSKTQFSVLLDLQLLINFLFCFVSMLRYFAWLFIPIYLQIPLKILHWEHMWDEKSLLMLSGLVLKKKIKIIYKTEGGPHCSDRLYLSRKYCNVNISINWKNNINDTFWTGLHTTGMLVQAFKLLYLGEYFLSKAA